MKQRFLTVRKLPASGVIAHHAFIFSYLSTGRSFMSVIFQDVAFQMQTGLMLCSHLEKSEL